MIRHTSIYQFSPSLSFYIYFYPIILQLGKRPVDVVGEDVEKGKSEVEIRAQ